MHLTGSSGTVCCTFILQLFAKLIAQPYRIPILRIDACHCFDWVSANMQNSGINCDLEEHVDDFDHRCDVY
jgi:hypothetical protein